MGVIQIKNLCDKGVRDSPALEDFSRCAPFRMSGVHSASLWDQAFQKAQMILMMQQASPAEQSQWQDLCISRGRQHQERARQSWNKHHKYMVFPHSHLQKTAYMARERRKWSSNRIKEWSQMGGQCPTEPYSDCSNYKEPSRDIREKKGWNFILFLFTDDIVLRFFEVFFFFFPMQQKIAACRYFSSSNKEVLVPKSGQVHSCASNIGCVFTGAFIKLQTYASLTRNHAGYIEDLILLYTKATLLIQCKGSLAVLPVYVLYTTITLWKGLDISENHVFRL